MNWKLLVLSGGIICGSLFIGGCNRGKTGQKVVMTEYQCPMNCEEGKTYKAEGKCPVCKMDLKEI